MYLKCTNCSQHFNTDNYDTLKPDDPCPICGADDAEPPTDEDGDPLQTGGIVLEWTTDIYVNVYMVDQAYGGREEGGWWYMAGYPVESRRFNSMPDAQKTLTELETSYNEENKGRRPISSVLSEGEYRVILETHFAEPWPKCRPHYE